MNAATSRQVATKRLVSIVRGMPSTRCLLLAANTMRPEDRREVWAAEGRTPLQALEAAFAVSPLCWTILLGRAPAFCCGVAPGVSLVGNVGIPWMLGTSLFTVAAPFAARWARGAVARMEALYPCLTNYAHADNATALRFLRWCGFTVAETPCRLGHENELFYQFWRKACVQ